MHASHYTWTILPDTPTIRDGADGQLVIFLNQDRAISPAGSLVLLSIEDMSADRKVTIVTAMTPTKAQAIEDVSATDNNLWVKALDDVEGKLFALRRDPATGKWSQTAVPLADNATVTIAGTIGKRDAILATAETMLTPPTLYSVTEDGAPKPVQSLPATFDAKDTTAENRLPRSAENTS